MAITKPFTPMHKLIIPTLMMVGVLIAALGLHRYVTAQQALLTTQIAHLKVENRQTPPRHALRLATPDSDVKVPSIEAAGPVSRLLVQLGWLTPQAWPQQGRTIQVIADPGPALAVAGLLLLIYCASLAGLGFHVTRRYRQWLHELDTSLARSLTQDAPPAREELPEFSGALASQWETQQQKQAQLEEDLSFAKQKVHSDPLTGLMNRRSFEFALASLFASENVLERQGALMLIRASSLQEINQSRGFTQGDNYLKNLARILDSVTNNEPKLRLYRTNGSDFAIIDLSANGQNMSRIAPLLKQRFDILRESEEQDNIAHMGIVRFSGAQLLEQVLAKADLALAKAETETSNGWIELADTDEQPEVGQQIWRKSIEEIIANQAVRFVAQPIISINRNTRGYSELYSRFVNASGEQMATESVFVMARRLDLIVRLEQLIITLALEYLENHAEDTMRIGINLSAQTFQSGSFLVWLERTLLRNSQFASRLVFEMPERDLEINLTAAKRLFDMLRRAGSYTAIDKFGRGVAAFRLYKELRPNFIKLDSRLVQQIADDKENQLFVRMMVDVAQRLGIWTVAEGVETMDQKNALVSLYVDALQGYLIARPQDLLSPTNRGRTGQLRNMANSVH